MAPRAGEGDHRHVGSGGDRTRTQPDRADVEFGFAVQADDRTDRVETTVAEHVERPARDALLGGLEHQPEGTWEFVEVVREVQGGAEHHGGVHVVSTRVGDPG